MDKVKLYKTEIKKNNKGNVIKYLERSKHLSKISEVYFSEIHKNKIKAWKKNISSEQFLFVYEGRIKLVIFDDRNPEKNQISEYYIGKGSKYSRIFLPKKVWYGFKGLNKKNVIINSIKIPHSKCKFFTKNLKDKIIPNLWK